MAADLLSITIEEENILPNIKVSSADEVIERLGRVFCESGFITEKYIPAVIEREKRYPTGLKTEYGYVAIPHADSTEVKMSGFAIATLVDPVIFKSMEDGIEEFPVDIVIMMAVKDPGSVVYVLQKVVALLRNKPALDAIRVAEFPSEIKNVITNHLIIQKDGSGLKGN